MDMAKEDKRVFAVLGVFFFFFGLGALAGIVYSVFKWGIPLIAMIVETTIMMAGEIRKGWRSADPVNSDELANRWAEKLGVRQTTPWRRLREELRVGAAEGRERGDRWAVKLGIKKSPENTGGGNQTSPSSPRTRG